MAAAIPPIAPHVPTANPRRSAGNAGSSNASDDGASSAAATACAVRPATSSPTVGAAAHTTEAIPNSARPTRNTRRRPHRSASRPAGTSSAANVTL